MASLNDFHLSWNKEGLKGDVDFHQTESIGTNDPFIQIGNNRYVIVGNQEQVNFIRQKFSEKSLESVYSMDDLSNKIKDLNVVIHPLKKIHKTAIKELQGITLNPVFNKISNYLDKLEQCSCFSGVVEITYDKDKSRTFTARGSDSSQPLFNTKTPFNVMSVGKVFTAIAVMQLVEQGKISLNDSIHQYLSSDDYILQDADEIYQKDLKPKDPSKEKTFRESLEAFRKNEKITIQDLLTHTSGLIGDPSTGYHFDQNQIGKWNYSNYGFQLLSRIVKNRSNTASFVDYVQQNIFTEPGTQTQIMPNALAWSRGPPEKEIAIPHHVFRGGLRSLEPSAEGVKLPPPDGNGCWWTTVHDLTLFAKAFIENKYFSKQQTHNEMLNPIISRTSDGFLHQGLGFWIAPGHPPAFLAQGSFVGRSAVICVIEMEKPIIISCVSNCGDGSNFFAEIIKIVRGEVVDEPLIESQKNGKIDKEIYDWLMKQNPPYNHVEIDKYLKQAKLPRHIILLLANDLEMERSELASILRN